MTWARVIVGFVAALALATLVALGWAWQRDRSTAWEVPRWDPERFTRLHALGSAADAPLHLVVVNPACPQCAISLDRAIAKRTARLGRQRIGVLIVDTPRPPASEPYARRGAEETWWDHAHVWRHRWGHRVYGEVLEFDSNGRYLATHPPLQEVTP